MPKETPSLVKNTIARCLSEIISPSPTTKEKKEIWNYFENKCAYCGKELEKGEGHLDHLNTYKDYFINDKYNRVLTSPTCNSKEKLDKNWKDFLKEKCDGNLELYNKRKTKIENWIKNQKEPLPNNVINKYIEIKNNINSVFTDGYEELKKCVKKQ